MITIYFRKLQQIVRRISTAHTANEKISRAIIAAISLNIFFGIFFYLVERNAQDQLTLLDSIWWAMVTMTTVGYGDFYAKTFAGRFLISYPCMLIGIGIIGYLVGMAAEQVLDNASRRRRGFMDREEKEHIIVCNFPGVEKVNNIIAELREISRYKDREIVLITDVLTELPEVLKKQGILFVKGSPVDEEVLNRANLVESAGVFILAEDPSSAVSDERSFAIGTIIEMISKEQDRPIKTVVELVNKENRKLIERSQVDGITSTDGITGCLLVQEFLYPGLNSIFLQLISNTVGSQFYIFTTRLAGHKVYDIQLAVLQHEENMQVIGIIKDGKPVLNPSKKMLIEEGDRLIMLAENRRDFEKIEEDILTVNN